MRSLPLLLLTAFFFSSCLEPKTSDEQEASDSEGSESTSSNYKELRDEIMAYKKRKRELEKKIEAIRKSQDSSSDLAKKEVETAEKLEKMRRYDSLLENHGMQVDESLEQWRAATRGSFKGVELPGITSIKGDEFSEVTILSVSDNSLTFRHSGGEETLSAMDLPPGLRKNIIHEPTVLMERQ